MGSKSSSGSLMKSVESMLPKNMNMKHVLLAVLVGLLLCMLMGQSVEGIKNLDGQDLSATNNGFCKPNIFTTPDQQCVADKYKQGSTGTPAVPSDATNDLFKAITDNDAKNAMNAACAQVYQSTGNCATANTGNDSAQKDMLRNSVRTYNSSLPSNAPDTKKVGGADGVPASYFSCKTMDVDQCAPSGQDACTSNDECTWKNCSSVLGTGFPFFGPPKVGDKPQYDFEGDGFNDWRNCLFTDNTASRGPTGTPSFSEGATDLAGTGGPALIVKYPFKIPIAGATGKTLTAAAGVSHIIDVGGALSKGVVPGTSADGGGRQVDGLTGWLKGKPGIPLTFSQNWNADKLRAANAIPLDGSGKIPTAMDGYLPANLKKGIENMYKWCGYGLTANKAKKAAVGWGDDLRSLKCLNYNPNISTKSTQSHKKYNDCIDIVKQSCKKISDNTDCRAGTDEPKNCWSTVPPTPNMVANATGVGGTATAAVAVTKAKVSEGVNTVVDGACSTLNLLKPE